VTALIGDPRESYPMALLNVFVCRNCRIFLFARLLWMLLNADALQKMTMLDDIAEIERETSAFYRNLLHGLFEENEENESALRDSLLDAPGQSIAFYKTTDLLTRRMTTEDAVRVWGKTRRWFLRTKKQWESVEKFGEPDIDGIVEHFCKVLDRLARDAQRQYRSYAETAHLLEAPANANRLAAALYEATTGRAQEMTLDELRIRSSGR
jgi:hypothetical protein